MRLGVLGGTFDPIHFGHIRMAEFCLDVLNLDKIFLIPAGNPPHKKPVAPYEKRVRMMHLAIEDRPIFEIKELEKIEQAKNYTYTYYTLKRLSEEHPDDELFFLMGEDNVSEINCWYRYEELLNMAQFVILSRENSDGKKLHMNDKLRYIPMPVIDISSKEIRNRLMNGKKIEGLVPEVVKNYILENNLYTKK
ncbi:MAG TPA: nicotinate (nicotinamide) nucleotide adenylyltransferase [Candidatus Cloacimonetes bacterium]|nr:nicotinate (nicotinamide) nucleotide adenylyltransferase [Candidatus Cloacimonadota bacterium]